jgi:hypothetical protein
MKQTQEMSCSIEGLMRSDEMIADFARFRESRLKKLRKIGYFLYEE